MEKTSLKRIADWSCGKLNSNPDGYVSHAAIDSRRVSKGTLFFCFRGIRNDGHDFIEDTKKKGGFSIGERTECDITVGSTEDAIGKIAKEYRKTINPLVIAVTGSSGKSTTVRILESILTGDHVVTASPHSFNNHIGLPLTVMKMNTKTQIAILEMGANHKGEIGYLCNIALPKIGIITNVGDAHIGNFGSIDAILNTKFELADSLADGATLVYNNDQENLKDKAVTYGDKLNLVGFGMTGKAEVTGTLIERDVLSSIFEVDGFLFKIKIPGLFNVYNSLAAIAVAKILDIDFNKVNSKLNSVKSMDHRLQYLNVRGIEILDDSYNSNPNSIKNLFSELLKMYPQKNIIAVISEMLELGNFASQMHMDIGEFISNTNNIEYLLAGGKYVNDIIEGAEKGQIEKANIYRFGNNKEAADLIKKISTKDSLVVLKASRLAHLENIIKYLKE
ncbi:UDP-N-acetylmuramoyl-tripeptide--D-alanyl-D-alanine ligase [Elusimicrobiota bacterium]